MAEARSAPPATLVPRLVFVTVAAALAGAA